jgi:hypothetical protein
LTIAINCFKIENRCIIHILSKSEVFSMKKSRKLLAILLAVTMYLSNIVFIATAEGESAENTFKVGDEFVVTLTVESSIDGTATITVSDNGTLGEATQVALKKGTQEYGQALKEHVNGFHGAELPGCISRKVFYDYPDKRAALAAMSGSENKCPTCSRQMLGSRWFSQPGRRYMDLATCPEHGKFLIRVRLSGQPDGTVRVSRLTYEATSEAAAAYARRSEKAEPEAERTGQRRRRSRLS